MPSGCSPTTTARSRSCSSASRRSSDGAHKQRQDLVQRITEALSVHASIEEEIFYPAARRAVADATGDVLEALEEHHLVKLTLAELEMMDPSHERYGAKVTVLIENVRHHVEEEEGELFPTVRKALDPAQLRADRRRARRSQADRTDPAPPRSSRYPARQHRRPGAHRTARRRRQPEQGGCPPHSRRRQLTDRGRGSNGVCPGHLRPAHRGSRPPGPWRPGLRQTGVPGCALIQVGLRRRP